jgi:hypothetical protein
VSWRSSAIWFDPGTTHIGCIHDAENGVLALQRSVSRRLKRTLLAQTAKNRVQPAGANLEESSLAMSSWDGKERRRGGNAEELRARIAQLQRQWEAEQAHAAGNTRRKTYAASKTARAQGAENAEPAVTEKHRPTR